ncbi:unannotated protein [freshwater metagenome]|uniref:Unannotated protein n=1 Tax=freshwater metagenome TaxID=449393 RepID=A0A6J7BKZ8_9ZZZZ
MRIVICAPQPSRDPASCCMVDVVNGGLGRSVRGLSSIDFTVNGVFFKLSVSAVACFSSSKRMSLSDFSFTAPSAPKSLVDATFLPSTESKRAVKPSSVFALRSHQEEEINAIRSRSFSTIKRVATDCTRPAEIRGITFFHKTGESRYP